MARRPRRTRSEAVYVISVAAELAGMHPQTLRSYERSGLVSPKRSSGNTRRYSEEDVERLQRIQELTSRGLNLVGVKMVLDLRDQLQEATARAARLERELEAATERLRDEVAAAHRSHRYELVRVEPRPLEVYRRTRSR
jgi:MerR family transcriptional regulator/heat shock protein HspR